MSDAIDWDQIDHIKVMFQGEWYSFSKYDVKVVLKDYTSNRFAFGEGIPAEPAESESGRIRGMEPGRHYPGVHRDGRYPWGSGASRGSDATKPERPEGDDPRAGRPMQPLLGRVAKDDERPTGDGMPRTEDFGEYESIQDATIDPRYRDRIRTKFEERGLSELDYLNEVADYIERETGPLSPWQRFYVIAVVSGRRVEWAQARGGPHYHVVGLPCTICGRR
jgi:hypothetical protein